MSEEVANHLARILVIDDERAIRRFLETALAACGFAVQAAESGRLGLAAIATFRPELILLDLGLPDLDGVEVLRRLREWSATPVIVLSVREREDDKVGALDAGADDYLTKPFGVPELLARIRAALRRAAPKPEEPVLVIDELRIDLGRRLVSVRERELQLTPTEYDLLRFLASHAGRVITHRQILKQIWGAGHLDQPHVLRVNISNLRHKIESDPSRPYYILTEAGIGYRFRAPAP